MTFKTAKEFFIEALTIAEQKGDPYREAIAAGLIDLTAAMQSNMTQLKSEIDATKRKIS